MCHDLLAPVAAWLAFQFLTLKKNNADVLLSYSKFLHLQFLSNFFLSPRSNKLPHELWNI